MAGPRGYSLSAFARYVCVIFVSLIPWAIALFLHYLFDQTGVWQAEMTGRALLSVLMLGTGMTLSFLIYGKLAGRR
ncbi:MAG: hypothetical protein AAGG55_10145 [Pseudomonadota bacterium]